MEDIIIIGYGGHARSVVDSIIKSGQYRIVGYTDNVEQKCSLTYLGTDDKLKKLYDSGIRNVALGVGFMGTSHTRDYLVKLVKSVGFSIPTIIDPSASLARDVLIGQGSFVGKNAVVNAAARIGDFCIINSGAIVEHDNVIEDYSHIAVGAVLCGNVHIGNHTMIGANSTIIQGNRIGNYTIIGAGSTVLYDVEDNMKVYGIVKNEKNRININKTNY